MLPSYIPNKINLKLKLSNFFSSLHLTKLIRCSFGQKSSHLTAEYQPCHALSSSPNNLSFDISRETHPPWKIFRQILCQLRGEAFDPWKSQVSCQGKFIHRILGKNVAEWSQVFPRYRQIINMAVKARTPPHSSPKHGKHQLSLCQTSEKLWHELKAEVWRNFFRDTL